MATIEFEFGALIMIKVPRFPRTRVVARLAFPAHSALVGIAIVLLVAGKTIGRRITEKLRLVAFLAFHFYMQTKQRKT